MVERRSSQRFCPLSGIGKRPLLGGITAMVFSIRNTASVRCSVGVRFSEGPLWEVPLYIYHARRGDALSSAVSTSAREIRCINVCTNFW